MDFGTILIVVVVVVVLFSILMIVGQSHKANEQQKVLAGIPDFNPKIVFKGAFGGAGVAIDPASKKIAISDFPAGVSLFGFEQLVAVELLRNGGSVQKANRGSQAAGAAVGALLLGPVGLLAGAVTGSKRIEEKIKNISIKLIFSDLENPVHEVVFFNHPNGMKADSFAVKPHIDEAAAWHGRFQAILHMNISDAADGGLNRAG